MRPLPFACLLWCVGVALAGMTGSSLSAVIVDTDPGIDDALALFFLMANPQVEVVAITCVRGNASPNQTAFNALKILQIANRTEIKVYSGLDDNFGLVESPPSDLWFGNDGLGDLNLRQIQLENPADLLARVVEERPGNVTILCLGPLTNLALALHRNPHLLEMAREVIVLGGSVLGNGNGAPGAEFNFFMDPYAAAVVLERAALSNTTITLIPMDTPNAKPLTYEWRWNVLGKINNSVVSFMNKLDERQQRVHNLTQYVPADAYATGVLYPGVITRYEDWYGYVLYDTKRSGGALMVDYLNSTSNRPNLHVAKEVNLTAFKDNIVTYLSTFP